MSWWYPVVSGEARRRRSGFVGTLTEARRAKAREAAPTAAVRSSVPVATASPTLYEFAKGQIGDELAPRSQHTTDRYETAYRLRIHGELGHYALTDLTTVVIRSWSDDLVRREGTRRCAEYAFRTLHWLLKSAVQEGLLDSNPASGVAFGGRAAAAVARTGAPASEDHERKKPALTREQYEEVKAHAASRGLQHLLLIRLATECALRRAELAALRRGGYDREARTFEVASGVTHTRTTGTVSGRLKTRTSRRVVVLSRDLCAVLDAYLLECLASGPDDFLFPGRVQKTRRFDATRPMNPRTVTGRVCALITEAGVLDDAGKHLTDLQGLRATGASLADAAGIPRSIVEAQLGHAGRSVYERHYRDVSLAPERFLFADVFES